jgi:hypothetical protein
MEVYGVVEVEIRILLTPAIKLQVSRTGIIRFKNIFKF